MFMLSDGEGGAGFTLLVSNFWTPEIERIVKIVKTVYSCNFMISIGTV